VALLLLGAAAAVWAGGCGQKFELPPQPEPGRIPEPGTYNRFAVWPLESPTDVAVRGSYIFIIENEERVTALLSYRPEVAPASIVRDFNGLIRPVRLAVAVRESIFVFVADAGDMTIKRYYFLGGDPLFAFTDSSWVEFSGLTADAQLNVYVSDASRDSIVIYDDRGRYARLLSDRGTGSGFVIAPHGIEHNGEVVVVSDTGKDWVQRLRPDTNNIAAYPTPIGSEGERLAAPEDVAVDRAGELIFVADTGKNRVLKYLTTGALEDTVYSPFKVRDVVPPISAPRFVAAEDDYVYISDSENGRVVVMRFVSQ
jgi:hypothetical protein